MSTQTQEQTQATGSGCCSSKQGCHSHDDHSHGHSHVAPTELFAPAPVASACTAQVAESVVFLTEKAAIEVKRFISEKNVPGECVLRIALQGGGCSGFEPHLGFDNKVSDEDIISEQFGIRVAIDKKFVMFMNGTTIDYHDGIDRRGFKFENPNATSSCGCGKSFSV